MKTHFLSTLLRRTIINVSSVWQNLGVSSPLVTSFLWGTVYSCESESLMVQSTMEVAGRCWAGGGGGGGTWTCTGSCGSGNWKRQRKGAATSLQCHPACSRGVCCLSVWVQEALPQQVLFSAVVWVSDSNEDKWCETWQPKAKVWATKCFLCGSH